MTVADIKEAISTLSEDERHSLTAWLNELEYDEWDRQMVEDFSPGGRGMPLVEEIERRAAEGNAVPLEQGLAQVKQLQGLLPICVDCKRIRDDQNYWHRVERYIADRTEAAFTHGLCPECLGHRVKAVEAEEPVKPESVSA